MKVGDVDTYIGRKRSPSFDLVATIPVQAAVAWVKAVRPEANMKGGGKAKDMVILNKDTEQWLNKLFVIVGMHPRDGKLIALYKSDGNYFVYIEED